MWEPGIAFLHSEAAAPPPFFRLHRDGWQVNPLRNPKAELRDRFKNERWQRPQGKKKRTDWQLLEDLENRAKAKEEGGGDGLQLPTSDSKNQSEVEAFRRWSKERFGELDVRTLKSIFNSMNFSRDKKLQQVEFVEGCRHIGYPTRHSNPSDQKRRKKLFFELDPDKSGGLDFQEFLRAFGQQHNAPAKSAEKQLHDTMRQRLHEEKRFLVLACQEEGLLARSKETAEVRQTASRIQPRFLPRNPLPKNNGLDPEQGPPLGSSFGFVHESDHHLFMMMTPDVDLGREVTAPPGPRPRHHGGRCGQGATIAETQREKRLHGRWLGAMALSQPLPPGSSSAEGERPASEKNRHVGDAGVLGSIRSEVSRVRVLSDVSVISGKKEGSYATKKSGRDSPLAEPEQCKVQQEPFVANVSS